MQQGVQRPVPRDVRRALHGGLHAEVEPLSRSRLHILLCGLDREDLGSQPPLPDHELRPGQR
eukprot:9744682-Prorocentrum_lima.AAC.1